MKTLFTFFFGLLTFFSLKAQDWSSPQDISEVLSEFVGEGVPPAIGVDAAGNAFAAFVGTVSNENIVFGSRFDVDTQVWTTTQIGSHNSLNARIGVTPDGKAIAVWQKDGFAYYNTYDPDQGGWQVEARIDPADPFNESQVRVGVDALGHALVVWQVPPGPLGHVIRSGIYTFSSQSWVYDDISTNYGVGNNILGNPDISVAQSGEALAVWRYDDGITSKIQSNSYNGFSWLPLEQDVNTSATDHLLWPIAAIDGTTGIGYAVWLETPDLQNYNVMGSERVVNIWNPTPTTLSDTGFISGGINPEKSPLFAYVDANGGNAIAIFSLINGSDSIIQGSVANGTNWGMAQTISNPTENSSIARVAVDGSGNAWAIWSHLDIPTQFEIQASKYTRSQNSWESIEIVSNSLRPFNVNADISTNEGGRYFALWLSSDVASGSPIFIDAAFSPASFGPEPPLNLIGLKKKQVFLTQYRFYAQLIWEASPSSDVVSYKILREGVVVATVPSSQLSYIDNSSSFPATFEVIAVDSNGFESDPATITIN